MRIGYARVSTADQNPELQIDELEGRGGAERIFTEKVSSLKLDKRVEWARCLDELARGDVLVVWKLDRAGRSVAQLSSLLEELKKRGVGFASVTEGMDTTTPGGEMIFHVFAAVAQFERALILERSRAGMAARRERDNIHTGPTPFGYRKLDSGVLEPDPDTGPVVSKMWKWAAEGQPPRQIADQVNEMGVKAPRGGAWTKSTVWRLIHGDGARTYLGEVNYGEWRREGAHDPLTDPLTFREARERRTRRTRDHSPSLLLSGLVRCAGCRYTMVSGGGSYKCTTHHAAGECASPATIGVHTIETLAVGRRRINGLDDPEALRPRQLADADEGVVAGLLQRDGTSIEQFRSVLKQGRTPRELLPVREELAAKLNELRSEGVSHRAICEALGCGDWAIWNLADQARHIVLGLEDYVVDEFFRYLEAIEAERALDEADPEPLERALQQANDELKAWVNAEAQITDAGGLDSYLAGLAARRLRRDEAQRSLDAVARLAGLPAREIREDWPNMSLEEQRDHLSAAIQWVFVRRNSREFVADGASADRVHVVWRLRGEPEVDVPRPNNRDYALRPFVFPDDADDPALIGEVAS